MLPEFTFLRCAIVIINRIFHIHVGTLQFIQFHSPVSSVRHGHRFEHYPSEGAKRTLSYILYLYIYIVFYYDDIMVYSGCECPYIPYRK